jgi:hypothetical protein
MWGGAGDVQRHVNLTAENRPLSGSEGDSASFSAPKSAKPAVLRLSRSMNIKCVRDTNTGIN